MPTRSSNNGQRTTDNGPICKWITNWPAGSVKWASCSAAMAAQIAAEGRCQVKLASADYQVRRHVLRTPIWAQTLAQRSPAVALALRLSPLDRLRESRRQAA